MADIDREQGQQIPPSMLTRYKDMGDGTHAAVVAAALLEGGNISSGTNPPVVSDPGTYAALNGDAVCGFVNEITPGAIQIVLTNATLFYNLNAGEIVMVTQFCMELTTLNDNVQYEIGYTSQVNGGGAFTALSPARYIRTGAANDTFQGVTTYAYPPARVRYADGARSVTFRVDCNDAGCTITPAWHGYIVRE